MAGFQSNQRHLNVSEQASPPSILYVAGKNDAWAFHSAHLREAGYDLHKVSSAAEALVAIPQTRPDVVVIGHGLSLMDRAEVEDVVRCLRPKPRIVLLYDTSISRTEQADAVLNVNSEPQHLVQTIRYLLTGSD